MDCRKEFGNCEIGTKALLPEFLLDCPVFPVSEGAS